MIIKALNDLPGFRCVNPGGAFYAFPNAAATGFDSRTLQTRLLDEAGVATIAGTSFGAQGDGYLRFSYAASLEALEEGVTRIRNWLLRQDNRAPRSA
jgi:aspartate/methionine/tyrosine aminotransferase